MQLRLFPLTLCVAAVCAGTAAAQPPMRGFTAAGASEQLALESRIKKIPDPQKLRGYMKRMSSAPHHAGSPGARAVAEYALGLFREWGLDAHLARFEALLPYPGTVNVEMTAPEPFRIRAQEAAIAEDRDSAHPDLLAVYNAYSGSGDVTAPLVYVNYGVPEDYGQLRRMGIDVRGKIVIARYGKSWRGTKPKVAQENGAAACLIYSDPREDGFFQGDVYPKGPFRPPGGVQRGSVLDMPLYAGDPLTPGWASEPGARRLPRDQARTILKIPVVPLSYADAGRLMKHLGGPVAPETWRGGMAFTYHLGPGPASVRVQVEPDWATRPLHNVIATIPGSAEKDQWVLYGNHHDAWGPGANDPASGASVLLETARTLAELGKTGWRPRRTIKLALWDGEEFGLIGSTEWVEKHRADLQRNAVVYLNTDATGKGRLNAGGTATLELFVNQAAADHLDSKDPGTGDMLRLGSLGAGSDYVAFLDHVGIASLNLGFDGPGTGVYHSNYDTFEWYTRFSDGDFRQSRKLAVLMASLLTRLAGASLLPFEFTRLVRNLESYTVELETAYSGGPLELGEWKATVKKLASAARMFETEYAAALARKKAGEWQRDRLARINESIFHTERALTMRDGLPGRPWYRHVLMAPGLYTGYSAKTLPGVREAADAGRWEEAREQVHHAAQAVKSLAAELVTVAGALKGLP